ncbi:MAG: 2OG-Fe(II) oxygenase [Cytophagales bacterium]|nr:2OG-Fe(II) oxygenase [Cytophagales bacterium]
MAHTHLFESLADGLADKGFAVVEGFLSSAEVRNILDTDEFGDNKLHFRKAGIGKTAKQINEAIRGDYLQWIDPEQASPVIRVYLDRLQQMIAFFNQTLRLSLKGVEVHRTWYPPGAHYARHVDQFRSDDHRKLSIICYVNEQWKVEHGGQLRLHLDDGAYDILPEGGRLVCFRSDLIEHEVLPATRDRLSLTGWAVDREPGTW